MNVPLSEEKLENVDGGTGLIIDRPTYSYAPSVCSKCGWTVNIVHNGPAFI